MDIQSNFVHPHVLPPRHYAPNIQMKTKEPLHSPLPKKQRLASPRSPSHHLPSFSSLTSPPSSSTSTSSFQTTTHSSWTPDESSPSSSGRRMSCPAVLDLTDEPRITPSLKHRNSIEAAMLLATFHLPQPSSTPDNSWDRPFPKHQELNHVLSTRHQRRYSYDGSRRWHTMPTEFLVQATLLDELKVKPYDKPASVNVSASSSRMSSPPRHPPPMNPSSLPPLSHPPLQHFQYVYPPPEPLPLGRPPTMPYPDVPPAYYPYAYYYNAMPPNAKLPMPMEMHPHGLLPRPPYHPMPFHPMEAPFTPSPGPTPIAPNNTPNAKRRRKELEEDESVVVMPGDPDFPDMGERDVEAAMNDPEARPRRQKLRYNGDLYTPKWVRFNGQAKEGLCDTCKPGKWLQLKNSAYWYHKQFYHGISSVSGKEFIQPLETRWVDQEIVEGLCHQCHHWVSVSNVKRKNSVLWFRHAHKCHMYHKPKNGGDAKRKP
ncbi:hypothetical protein DM01DRAFT_1323840 [Hesseltinella vesiculosa]|uniref:Transcription regulator Rua1 C-terminal domain-containing protein n=1 Tax=Hesseltinella vesiculosa TaxID=101127 RepID=A0A1X2GEH6_9FUNG|nr:hypothetical protein DM01DRAFT_1323840 [Hesseltinella vesiculosa]